LDILEGFSGRGAERGMSQRGASAGKIEEFVGIALYFQAQWLIMSKQEGRLALRRHFGSDK
jgi:hypothetical protein